MRRPTDRRSPVSIATRVAVAASIAICGAPAAHAADIVVTQFDDPAPTTCTVSRCSLREAVTKANQTPGFDRIILDGGTYVLAIPGINENANLTGDLDVTDDLEIVGAGPPFTLVRQDADSERILDIRPTANRFDLRKLRIIGGGTFELPVESGGGVYVRAGTTTLIEDVTFDTNFAAGYGGGLYYSTETRTVDEGPGLVVRRSIFTNNRTAIDATGESGGAIYVEFDDGGPRVIEIIDSLFTDNVARRHGGAIAFDTSKEPSGDALYIGQTRFLDNTVIGRGGAIALVFAGNSDDAATMRIAASTFSGNRATGDGTASFPGQGGAISTQMRTNIVDSMFDTNEAVEGGALWLRRGGRIGDTTICDNEALDAGGGVLAEGPLTISRSTICRNDVTTADTAMPGGGGIAYDAGAADLLSIFRSTVAGNTALRGGSVTVVDGSVDVSFSTIARPSFVNGAALGTAIRHTEEGNTATTRLYYAIIVGTCSWSGPQVPTAAYSSIESIGNTCRFDTATNNATNMHGVTTGALALGSLADNGGPTDTMMPGAGSVALDYAILPVCNTGARDQRHFVPDDISCDVGAVERGATASPDALFSNGVE